MLLNRKELLNVLATASVGTTKREVLEQSNSFVFDADKLITFNEDICTDVKTPIPEVEGAVPAEDLLALLARFPDDEVDIWSTDKALKIKAGPRDGEITLIAKIQLPFGDVPGPGKWQEVAPELMGTLLQAARVCGKNEALLVTTVVHFTSKWVESSDNFRIFRSELETSIEGDLLVPATALESLANIAHTFRKFSVNRGWLHFLTKTGHTISVRCARPPVDGYPTKMISAALDGWDESKKIELPETLKEVIERAEVMQDYNGLISVSIEDGYLKLRARKDTGWFSERKRIDYTGSRLAFEVNSKFLKEILTKTRVVRVLKNRMRIKSEGTVFMVCLEALGEEKP